MRVCKPALAVLVALGVLTTVGLIRPRVAEAQAPVATAATPELQHQYDVAFQDMLLQPANLDVLFKFATIASKTGDLEGSISALERMLLINPNLPRVRLELGVLYYRLGSFEVARTYFEAALSSANVPPEIKARADEFLAAIKSAEKPSHFSGEAFLGWRFQSDANLGPATSNVLLFGQIANLNQQAVGTPDWGVVGSVQVRHVYDFGRQDKEALETQFTAYSSRQFQVTTANVSLLDLVSGPRFQIFNGTFQDVSLKPFLAGGAIWINDTLYYPSYGAGVEGSALLADKVRNTTTFLFRKHDNQDTWYLPTNVQYRGSEYDATTAFQYQITDLVTFYVNGAAQRFNADLTPVQAYWLSGVGGGMAFHFTDPVFKTGLQWGFNLSVNEQWWSYDAPDPTVSPTTMRTQNDTIINLVFSMPLDAMTTFSLSGGRFLRGASLPNYAFENDSVMFGVSRRF